jgi:hypothetical protein
MSAAIADEHGKASRTAHAITAEANVPIRGRAPAGPKNVIVRQSFD